MRELPKANEIWLHFKGGKYQIITLAEHTETGEKFVIYKALSGTMKTYARPLKDFMSEIDKEKFIGRQTYKSDAQTKENDAEHAWHMAVMTVLLSEYANEKIDVLKTVTMLLIHDIVEIDAGDTYAYDEEGKKTQREREVKAADRIFGILPDDQRDNFRNLWEEFEKGETPEAKFAHTMDNFQPAMLNDLTEGKSWVEKGVHLSQILERNKNTAAGSKEIWDYAYKNIFEKNVEAGKIKKDN